MMRKILITSALVLAVPLSAQEAEDDEGYTLMEEGARMFFEGLMGEMEPAFRELEGLAEGLEPRLRDFVREMGPAMRDLMIEVEDWSAYHPPEVLPNGDIIIRRKTPQEMLDAPQDTPEEVEL